MNQSTKPIKPLNMLQDDDYVAPGLPSEKTVPESAARAWRKQREVLARPQPSSFLDPVSIMLTVDVLLRLEPEARLTAAALTRQMQQLYPHILWDQYNVGRIMSSIAEASAGSGAPADEPPVTSYRSAGTRQYVVNANLQNWRWLVGARHYLGKLAEETIDRDRTEGAPTKLADFPWEAFNKTQWGS